MRPLSLSHSLTLFHYASSFDSLFWQLSLFTQALEIKKLNKLVGVTESPKFGNESRKDLKVRLARAQEDLKDLQLSSAERVKQVRGRICKFDYC